MRGSQVGVTDVPIGATLKEAVYMCIDALVEVPEMGKQTKESLLLFIEDYVNKKETQAYSDGHSDGYDDGYCAPDA